MDNLKQWQRRIAASVLGEEGLLLIDIRRLPFLLNIPDCGRYQLINADFLARVLPSGFRPQQRRLLFIKNVETVTRSLCCIEQINCDSGKLVNISSAWKLYANCNRLNDALSWETCIEVKYVLHSMTTINKIFVFDGSANTNNNNHDDFDNVYDDRDDDDDIDDADYEDGDDTLDDRIILTKLPENANILQTWGVLDNFHMKELTNTCLTIGYSVKKIIYMQVSK